MIFATRRVVWWLLRAFVSMENRLFLASFLMSAFTCRCGFSRSVFVCPAEYGRRSLFTSSELLEKFRVQQTGAGCRPWKGRISEAIFSSVRVMEVLKLLPFGSEGEEVLPVLRQWWRCKIWNRALTYAAAKERRGRMEATSAIGTGMAGNGCSLPAARIAAVCVLRLKSAVETRCVYVLAWYSYYYYTVRYQHTERKLDSRYAKLWLTGV